MFGNKEKLAKILSRFSSQDAAKVLAYIAQRDTPLSETIKKLMFGFGDIEMLSDKEMQRVHEKIDFHDLVLALKGLDDSQKETLLRGISAKRKATVLSELELTGAVKVKEVEAARQRIAQIVRDMIDAGEISPGEAWIE